MTAREGANLLCCVWPSSCLFIWSIYNCATFLASRRSSKQVMASSVASDDIHEDSPTFTLTSCIRGLTNQSEAIKNSTCIYISIRICNNAWWIKFNVIVLISNICFCNHCRSLHAGVVVFKWYANYTLGIFLCVATFYWHDQILTKL